MKKTILLSMILASFFTNAAVIPVQQSSDKRIVSAMYDPSNVIIIQTRVGTSTLVQLEDGETIVGGNSGIGMGDAQAWGFNVKGNNIFFKPTAKNPDTNLTVVSDLGRTYAFELVSSRRPFYIVKMEYKKPYSIATNKKKVPCSDGSVNFQYQKWGKDALSPQYAWDDGRFTCMKFQKNSELPVVYQIGSDGKEAIVNYHIERDTVVIHAVANEFRLRLGDDVLGIKSDAVKYAGFNEKSSTIRAKRIIKE